MMRKLIEIVITLALIALALGALMVAMELTTHPTWGQIAIYGFALLMLQVSVFKLAVKVLPRGGNQPVNERVQ